jgi:hypothetical protein
LTGDTFYLDIYVGDPTSCSGGFSTYHYDLSAEGLVVVRSRREAPATSIP